MLIVIFFFFDSCLAFVILLAGAGRLRATTGLLGELSAELEAGLDGGCAGDLGFASSGATSSAFAATLTLTLTASSAWFFFGLTDDSKDTVAWRSSPRGASVGGDGSLVLSTLLLRSRDSLEEDLGV